MLQSLPKEKLAYPLEPTNDPAQVVIPSTPSQMGEVQGQYPRLKAELEAEAVPQGEAFSQR